MPTDLKSEKAALRETLLRRRAGADPSLGAGMARRVLAQCPPPTGAVVAGYWPIGDEIDPRPLLAALHDLGHPVVLPRTPARGQALSFHRWEPGMALEAGRFGTSHPPGESIRPDWLLVPLLAFDRSGNRLGYGAGYYDRTLAELPDAVAVGCGYAMQEVASVPVDAADVPLGAVATEREVIFPGASRVG